MSGLAFDPLLPWPLVAAIAVLVTAAAALAIVVLLLMLGSLFSWLRQDLAITFADLTDNITDAVIIGK